MRGESKVLFLDFQKLLHRKFNGSLELLSRNLNDGMFRFRDEGYFPHYIRSITSINGVQAAQTAFEANRINFIPSLNTYQEVFKTYAHHGHVDEMMELFQRDIVHEKLQKPNAKTFEYMIKSCLENGCVHDARVLLKLMVDEFKLNDTILWNWTMKYGLQEKDVDVVLKLYEDFRQRRSLKASVYTYALVMGAGKLNCDAKLMVDIVEAARKDGLLDVTLCNSAIDGCLYDADRGFKVFLDLLKDEEMELNEISFNVMLKVFAHNTGMSSKAKLVFNNMLISRFKPSPRTIYSLLKTFAKDGEHNAARKLIENMSYYSVKVDVSMCNAGLESCILGGYVDTANLLCKMMDKKGIKPNHQTIAHLLLIYLNAGAVDAASQLMNQTESTGDRAILQSITYQNAALKVHAAEGSYAKIISMVKQLPAMNIKPKLVTYGLVFQAYKNLNDAEGAFQYYFQLQGVSKSQDTSVFNMLLSVYASLEASSRVHALYLNRVEQGRKVDPVTYNTVLTALLKGDVDTTLATFLQDNPFHVNNYTIQLYTSIFLAYEKLGMHAKCRETIRNLLSSTHLQPNLHFLTAVIDKCPHVELEETLHGFLQATTTLRHQHPDIYFKNLLLHATHFSNTSILEYLLQMLSITEHPMYNLDTIHKALQVCHSAKDEKTAFSIFNQLKLKPDSLVYELVLKTIQDVHCIHKVFQSMQDQNAPLSFTDPRLVKLHEEYLNK